MRNSDTTLVNATTTQPVGTAERRRLLTTQIRRETRAAAVLETEHLALRNHALAADFAPAAYDRGATWQQPQQCPHRGQRLAEASREQPDDELDQRHQDELNRPPEHPRSARQCGDGAHPVPRLQRAVIEIRSAVDQSFAMTDAGIGRDDD